MKDFTLRQYKKYLEILKSRGFEFIRIDDYIKNDLKGVNNLCVLRHDVDRRPYHSLAMAKLESDMGIKATYYFRAKNCSFKPAIMEEINSLGHEVGYHYETLSDKNGDFTEAYKLFEKNLNKFRDIAPIKTISMHGRPLSPIDNRDLWSSEIGKKKMKELKLLGEVYFEIDYTNIAYISDTGRNWTSGKSNLRDSVTSDIDTNFKDSIELEKFFNKFEGQICFQVHPERWDDSFVGWGIQYLKDSGINVIKTVLRAIR